MAKIGEIAEVFDGPHATPKKIKKGPYFLSISSLERGRLDLSKSAFLSEGDFKKWTKRVTPQKGDLLFSYETRLGEAALMPQGVRACLGRRMGLLRPKTNKVLPEYLLYAYISPAFQQTIISNIIRGATVDRIALNELPNYEIFIPSLSEQAKVSNLLQNIDLKIELNNKINDKIEAMAKTLFDYWFLQFDFPTTKEQAYSMGNPKLEGKPYKTSGGKMVFNTKLNREIPEGWEVNSLSTWINSEKTGDWGKDTLEGNYTLPVNCIRGADINGLNGKGDLIPPKRYILAKNSHKILSEYDMIVEISGGSPSQSTGRIALITEELLNRFNLPLVCSNFCKAISLKNNSYYYVFAAMWNQFYDNGVLFGWEGKTSGIKNLLFDAFISHHPVFAPSEDIARKFSAVASSLQKEKQIRLRENTELKSLRDWLLPMLMNGQVTLK